MMGRAAVAWTQEARESRTSLEDSRPASGAPARAAATEKPDMKAKGKPARSMRRADRPS
jgi:hypothetical protein